METTIDGAGRIVVPKPLREALGLVAGATVDISPYGSGLQLTPGGRIARLERRNGRLVAVSDQRVSDADVFAAIDAGRR